MKWIKNCIFLIVLVFILFPSCKKRWPDGLSEDLIILFESNDIFRVEEINAYGLTTLHLGSAYATIEELRVLIEFLPENYINKQDENGNTPVLYLLSKCKGGNICYTTEDNEKGIDHLKNLIFLYERGADLNIADNSGTTPLRMVIGLCDDLNDEAMKSSLAGDSEKLEKFLRYFNRAEMMKDFIKNKGGSL